MRAPRFRIKNSHLAESPDELYNANAFQAVNIVLYNLVLDGNLMLTNVCLTHQVIQSVRSVLINIDHVE